MSDEIRIENPLVLGLHASIAEASEAHVDWSLGYAPEAGADGSSRFILARLDAGNEDGSITVEIGAGQTAGPLTHLDEAAGAEFVAQLVASPSLGMLYGLARITAQGLLGTIESDLTLPWDAPAPTITRLVRADLDDES